MALQENDFIEIKFTGKVKDGEVFDSNIKEDLEEMNKSFNEGEKPVEAKPFIFCLGKGMFLKSLDEFLIGKPEKPEFYNVELKPEEAFGHRDSKLTQIIPSRIFKEHKINPVPGIMFNFDGRAGKILTVSGGRIIVDFNHSLAGKTIEYKINFVRKITDVNKKINALNDFFFRKPLDFKVKVEEKKLIFNLKKDEAQLKNLIELLKDKYKEMLDLEVGVGEVEIEKEEKKEEKNKSDI